MFIFCFEVKQKFATVDGNALYKVQVTGTMMSSNVLSACNVAKLRTPCYADSYADANCVLIGACNSTEPHCMDHGYTQTIFHAIMNNICSELNEPDETTPNHMKPTECQPLRDAFAYTGGKYGGGQAFGIAKYGGSGWTWQWGNVMNNKFALCMT